MSVKNTILYGYKHTESYVQIQIINAQKSGKNGETISKHTETVSPFFYLGILCYSHSIFIIY